MKKLTWISTPTELFCASSRAQAYALAPEGACLCNHAPAAHGKPEGPAPIPFAVIRNGKPVKVQS